MTDQLTPAGSIHPLLTLDSRLSTFCPNSFRFTHFRKNASATPLVSHTFKTKDLKPFRFTHFQKKVGVGSFLECGGSTPLCPEFRVSSAEFRIARHNLLYLLCLIYLIPLTLCYNPLLERTTMPPRTLYEKIWDSHVVHEAPGEPALIYIDRHLIHEGTSPQAFAGLKAAGRKVRRPD